MNKKILAAVSLCLCMMLACACALGEITVTKRDMVLNRSLDKNVNNILVIMQDGGVTDAMMIASINSRTGRSVMTQLDCATPVSLPEAGEMTLGDVYAQGAKKSRGLLAARTVNSLLDLNVSTYVALDIGMLPSLVGEIGTLAVWLNDEEAEILGTWQGDNSLSGEQVLEYVRIRLESDYAEKNRSYMVFMDLLKQGLRASSGANLMGLGKKLLSGMDTNLNALAAVTMLSSFQAGDDRRELYLGSDMSPEQMREAFFREVYE
ncbi:MAG: LCP family protein [Clostridia bacterium]|nr:LCP family protein [Clostridia bacterium]